MRHKTMHILGTLSNGGHRRVEQEGAMNLRKLANAILGLAAGVITLPLAIFAWPLFAAWFFWNEAKEK